MEIEDTYNLGIPINELWNALLNPYYFGRFIPNINSIVKIEEDVFRLKGNFNLNGNEKELTAILKISNKVNTDYISLNLTQEGTLTLISAQIDFYLKETSEMSTLANYKLAIKMPFLIKAMMGNKANELIQRNASDFFSKLEEHLKS